MLPLFTAAVFLSASLLFMVQPMVARMLVPMLGGRPAVWNTSMVVRVARDSGHFTFLKGSDARVEVVLGDGRLTLAHAPPGTYDLIVVDAFSSDAIPVHLITREAVRMYSDKLADGGLVAFHVSNRYLELRYVLGAIAQDLGFAATTMDEGEEQISPRELGEGKLATTWVALARRVEDFGALNEDKRWIVYGAAPGTPLWTDDDSNILGAIRWSR